MHDRNTRPVYMAPLDTIKGTLPFLSVDIEKCPGIQPNLYKVFFINDLFRRHFGKAVPKAVQGRTKKLFDLAHAV